MAQDDFGVTCMDCKSVLFSIKALHEHLNLYPDHPYYKHGNTDFIWDMRQWLPQKETD